MERLVSSRNIPYAKDVLDGSCDVIKNETTFRGNWSKEVFGNNHPLHIEIGMGKGQFLTKLAMRNPDINYIGIERYSSVLLRAVEKLEALREEEILNFLMFASCVWTQLTLQKYFLQKKLLKSI